jgi:hypothetical protein
MLGHLDNKQVEYLLNSQFIGRVGCHNDGVTYVVPITYAYDGTYIYGHSAKGMKINMMRKNPEVCFEVESVSNMANWQSVIAWGKFEEITAEAERQQAMQKLINHLRPQMTSETAQPTHGINTHAQDTGHQQAILFRIKLNNKTGRFEKR